MTPAGAATRAPRGEARHTAGVERGERMRLAYLSCDFGVPTSGPSGKSVHVRETVNALRRLGHAVKVFSPRAVVDPSDACRKDVHPVPLEGCSGEMLPVLAQEMAEPPHLVTEWRALLYSEYAQRALLPFLAAFKPDVIYERYSLFSYAGLELARQLEVSFVLEVNAPLRNEQSKYRELVLERTAEELERRVLGGADALLVVSSALAEHARHVGVPSERITVLPNAADTHKFHPGVAAAGVRSLYGLEGKRVIGFFGSLKRWHDLETLLAAVERLVRVDRSIHLLVVGYGPRFDELQSLEMDYITCTGAVEHDQVPHFLAAMDVVTLPYPRGGDAYFSPLKLFEAMAMGKPIVGARLGQVAEIIRNGETGLLYEPGDGADLACRIAQVLELPDRGAALGAAARRDVAAGRTWELNARRIVAVAGALKRP